MGRFWNCAWASLVFATLFLPSISIASVACLKAMEDCRVASVSCQTNCWLQPEGEDPEVQKIYDQEITTHMGLNGIQMSEVATRLAMHHEYKAQTCKNGRDTTFKPHKTLQWGYDGAKKACGLAQEICKSDGFDPAAIAKQKEAVGAYVGCKANYDENYLAWREFSMQNRKLAMDQIYLTCRDRTETVDIQCQAIANQYDQDNLGTLAGLPWNHKQASMMPSALSNEQRAAISAGPAQVVTPKVTAKPKSKGKTGKSMIPGVSNNTVKGAAVGFMAGVATVGTMNRMKTSQQKQQEIAQQKAQAVAEREREDNEEQKKLDDYDKRLEQMRQNVSASKAKVDPNQRRRDNRQRAWDLSMGTSADATTAPILNTAGDLGTNGTAAHTYPKKFGARSNVRRQLIQNSMPSGMNELGIQKPPQQESGADSTPNAGLVVAGAQGDVTEGQVSIGSIRQNNFSVISNVMCREYRTGGLLSTNGYDCAQ